MFSLGRRAEGKVSKKEITNFAHSDLPFRRMGEIAFSYTIPPLISEGITTKLFY